MGYALGCLSPAWLLSKLKGKDLKRAGTSNLGATNAFMVLGKSIGAIVMLLDMAKAFAAVRLALWAFPGLAAAGIAGGGGAILGHLYPFYLRFQGGKGLACLGGMVLGLDWRFFFPLLLAGLLLAAVTNVGCMVAVSASVLWPAGYALAHHSLTAFLLMALPCALMLEKHRENLRRVKAGTEPPFRMGFAHGISCRKRKRRPPDQES